MTIEILPEDRLLVHSLVEAGEYESVESCLHAALAGLSGEFDEEAAAQIADGIAQLDRGEGRTLENVQQNLAARRTAWREKQGVS